MKRELWAVYIADEDFPVFITNNYELGFETGLKVFKKIHGDNTLFSEDRNIDDSGLPFNNTFMYIWKGVEIWNKPVADVSVTRLLSVPDDIVDRWYIYGQYNSEGKLLHISFELDLLPEASKALGWKFIRCLVLNEES